MRYNELKWILVWKQEDYHNQAKFRYVFGEKKIPLSSTYAVLTSHMSTEQSGPPAVKIYLPLYAQATSYIWKMKKANIRCHWIYLFQIISMPWKGEKYVFPLLMAGLNWSSTPEELTTLCSRNYCQQHVIDEKYVNWLFHLVLSCPKSWGGSLYWWW